MLSILMLRHNAMLLKINERLIKTFLDKHDVEYELTAPTDFCLAHTNGKQLTERLSKLLNDNSSYSVIFFEANLGFPGTNDLREPTVNALQLLIKKCPEATFILKSNSTGATTAAKTVLLNESFPQTQIIVADGLEQLTDEMHDLLLDKVNNQIHCTPYARQ